MDNQQIVNDVEALEARVARDLENTQRKKRNGKYPVICAWCWNRDRKRVVVGRSEVEGSHGICRKHARQLRTRRFRRSA